MSMTKKLELTINTKFIFIFFTYFKKKNYADWNKNN